MSYLPQQGSTEAEDQQGVNPQMTGGAADAGGGTTAAGGGGGPGQATPTHSGNFTNLKSYINANQAQAPQLGQQVAGEIGQQAQKARGALSGASQTFNTQATSATPTIDQTLLQKAWTNPQGLSSQEQASFAGQRNAAYTGPKQLSDVSAFSQVPGAIQSAQEYGNLINSEAGRQQLVGGLYGGRTAAPGLTSLDALLLQNSPEAMAAGQAANADVKNLTGEEQAAETAAQQQAAAGQQAAQGVQQNFQNYFYGPQGVVPTFGQELSDRAKQELAAAQAGETAAQQGLSRLVGQYVHPSQVTQTLSGPTNTGTAWQAPAAPTVMPDWATQAGLNQDQYNQLVTGLKDYGTFDTSGTNPIYAQSYGVWGHSNLGYRISDTAQPGYTEVMPTNTSALQQYYTAPQVNLSQYLQQMPADALAAQYTQQSVQTPEEAARLNALSGLLGQPIDYANTSNVPAPAPASSFDLQAALDYLNQQQQAQNEQAYKLWLAGPGIHQFLQSNVLPR